MLTHRIQRRNTRLDPRMQARVIRIARAIARRVWQARRLHLALQQAAPPDLMANGLCERIAQAAVDAARGANRVVLILFTVIVLCVAEHHPYRVAMSGELVDHETAQESKRRVSRRRWE